MHKILFLPFKLKIVFTGVVPSVPPPLHYTVALLI